MDPQIERTAKSDQGRTIHNQVQTTMQMSETVCEGEQVFGEKRARGKGEEKGREVNTHNLQRLKEPFLMCLLIHGHLDMRMLRHLALCQLRTRLDTSQPVITLIFILSVIHMILTSGSVLIMRVASAEQVARLPLPLQEIGQRAPRAGLDVHHAADTRAGLSREETEDGLCASGVESGDG